MFIQPLKMSAQNIWSQDLAHKIPFGYRVAQHLNSFLTSCPGTDYNLQTIFKCLKAEVN